MLFAACGLALLSATTVSAQTCFLLANSTVVPDYNNYAVARFTGSTPTDSFIDTPTFDSFISARNDSNLLYVNQFKAVYGCPGFTGHFQRYHLSIFVGSIMNTSRDGCAGTAQSSQATTFIPMCQSTCNLAINAFMAILNNATVCTPAQSASASAIAERNSTLSGYQNFCSKLTVADPNKGTCREGILRETNQCGFPLLADGVTFCQDPTTSADPCCATLASSYGGVLPTNPKQTDPNNSSGGSGGLTDENRALVIGIAAGAGAFIFTSLAAVGFLVVRNRRRDGTLKRIIEAIKAGRVMKVVYEYSARIADEMRLSFGDIVDVDEIFDDGWAAGRNRNTGESGAFPLIAVAPFENENDYLTMESVGTNSMSMSALSAGYGSADLSMSTGTDRKRRVRTSARASSLGSSKGSS
ncbi:hypothetical protein BJ742DRAFT_678873 [Cladochytrium replicatum]|nr:hypothetical protein BJ742DRAFT_678873 [Cladochytrium replicatum]